MITDHVFVQKGHASVGYCGHRMAALSVCGAHQSCHTMLPSDPPVRSDLERAYERIKELELERTALYGKLADRDDQLHDSEEERLRAVENAKNTQLRLTESLAREGGLRGTLAGMEARWPNTDELERVKAERDMAWDRIDAITQAAQEILARIENLIAST